VTAQTRSTVTERARLLDIRPRICCIPQRCYQTYIYLKSRRRILYSYVSSRHPNDGFDNPVEQERIGSSATQFRNLWRDDGPTTGRLVQLENHLYKQIVTLSTGPGFSDPSSGERRALMRSGISEIIRMPQPSLSASWRPLPMPL